MTGLAFHFPSSTLRSPQHNALPISSHPRMAGSVVEFMDVIRPAQRSPPARGARRPVHVVVRPAPHAFAFSDSG